MSDRWRCERCREWVVVPPGARVVDALEDHACYYPLTRVKHLAKD